MPALLIAVEAGTDAAVSVALIGAIGGLGVAVVTGVFAMLKERKPEPSPVRYVEEPTSHALPAALSELYEDAVERAVKAERERDDIKQWAVEHGWQQ